MSSRISHVRPEAEQGSAPLGGSFPIRLRVSRWHLLIPGSLLALAGIFTLGSVLGPESEAAGSLIIGLSLAVAAMVLLAWGWAASAGMDASGNLYVHYPARHRQVSVSSLSRIDMRPRRQGTRSVPAWNFRLTDAGGRTLRLSAMTWDHDQVLFRVVAEHVHASRTVEVDPVARGVLWSLAGLDPARTDEIRPEPASPGPSPWGRFLLALVISAVSFAVTTQLRGTGEPSSSEACRQVDALNQGLAQSPDPSTPDAVNDPSGVALVATWERLSPSLLANPGAGYQPLVEWAGGLERTAAARDDPDSLEVLREHSFKGAAFRAWQTPEGLRLEHAVIEFSSARDAQSFEVHATRYACRFADAAWRADLHPPRGSAIPGLGLQVRHQVPAVVEQISWTRGPRRHVISVGLSSVSQDHGYIARLARRAAGHDSGQP